jgi:hypothetical protein
MVSTCDSCMYQCEVTQGLANSRVPHLFEIMKSRTKDAPFTYVKAVDSIVSMGYVGSCLLYMQLYMFKNFSSLYFTVTANPLING